jgi:hypothetical protein
MKPKIIQRECKHHGITDFHLEKRGAYRCKKCRSDRVTKYRRNRKQKLVEYFGGKCQLCGYDKCQQALEFHHLDKSQKEFGISHRGLCRLWDIVLTEAKKCILLCANCHAEVENGITICNNSRDEMYG